MKHLGKSNESVADPVTRASQVELRTNVALALRER
jgi:hypothetical protein